MVRVLIDGDSIAYKAAACCGGDLKFMGALVDGEMGRIFERCQTSDYEMWIESPIDKRIFRMDIAQARVYKGNRSHAKRPEHLLEAKRYMAEAWNAKETAVFESEDQVIARAYQLGLENVIIAFCDKDLLMHPCRFYNYRNDSFITVDEKQAETTLWRQVCSGDSADNIPGIPGVGAVKAQWAHDLNSCVRMYKDNGMSYEYFVEQYNLIYIRNELHTKIIYPLSKDEWEKL